MWHRSHICTQGLGFSLLPVFCRQQRPYNLIKLKNHTRAIIFQAVYCIVNRFNSRVRLLRTKQRVLGSAGMLAAVAEPFGFPPPTHLSNIFRVFFFFFYSIPPLPQSPHRDHLLSPQPLANNIFIHFLISIKSCKLPQTSPHHFLP